MKTKHQIYHKSKLIAIAELNRWTKRDLEAEGFTVIRAIG